MKTPRILGFLITSVLATGAFATGENTVTSKSYVDAMDATKQGIIPASGTNASEPGESVITYTDTAGTIGERGIFNFDTDYDGGIVEGHQGDLMTAIDVVPEIDNLWNTVDDVSDQLNDVSDQLVSIPSIQTSKLTCANQAAGCTLWQIDNQYALQGTCKAYGILYGSGGVSECCSGVGDGQLRNTCGCQDDTDCPSGTCDTQKHHCS